MAGGERTPVAVWALLGVGLLTLGSSAILIRLADGAPALALAAWRTIFAASILAPLALLRARREIRALPLRDVGLVVAAGVLLGLHFVGWIRSVQLTSVASASVLVTTSPLFIAVLGVAFLRERPRAATWAAIGAATVGSALIGLDGGAGSAAPHPALGNALALLAALLVSVYLLVGRVVRQRLSFAAYFAPLNAVAAGTAVLACLATGTPLGLPWPVLGLCLLMALGPGLLGHGSFVVALRYLPAALLGLLTLAEPVIASAAAAVLFGERPGGLALAGAVLVLGSIAAVVWRRERSG